VRKGKSSWETQAASNSDGNESSATDDGDGEETRKSSKRGGAPRRSKPTTKKKQRNGRKLPTIVYTDAQLSGLLKDVIDKGKYRCPLAPASLLNVHPRFCD
jgi:timeless